MPRKDVYLFDDSNMPLQVNGIRVELFDAATGTLLDAQNSAYLNPGEWGVQLRFSPGNDPLDIYITDPTYRYPGNTVRYLNGQLGARVDIDLLQTPSGHGGQRDAPASATIASLSRWVEQGEKWSSREKKAVRNLLSNYLGVIVPRIDSLSNLEALHTVARNWEEAIERLGLPPELLNK